MPTDLDTRTWRWASKHGPRILSSFLIGSILNWNCSVRSHLNRPLHKSPMRRYLTWKIPHLWIPWMGEWMILIKDHMGSSLCHALRRSQRSRLSSLLPTMKRMLSSTRVRIQLVSQRLQETNSRLLAPLLVPIHTSAGVSRSSKRWMNWTGWERKRERKMNPMQRIISILSQHYKAITWIQNRCWRQSCKLRLAWPLRRPRRMLRSQPSTRILSTTTISDDQHLRQTKTVTLTVARHDHIKITPAGVLL